MVRKWSNILLFLLGLLLFCSCNWGKTVYHRYTSVGRSWEQNSPVTFDLSELRSGKNYQLFIDVRYTGAYPYRDLYLEVLHNLEKSDLIVADTFRLLLGNERGLPVGVGLTGLYQYESLVKTFVLDGGENTTVVLKHLMQDSLLFGVTDVGIRVEQVN